MRFFQKRRAVIDIEERGSESISHHVNDDNSNGSEVGAFQKDPFPPFSHDEYRYMDINMNMMNMNLIDKTTAIEDEYPKNKQSIGELVRKLNCSASKKYDDEDIHQKFGGEGEARGVADYLPKQIISPRGSVSPSRRNDALSDITRPVLITVKDGDVNQPDPLSDHNNIDNSNNMSELKSTFIVGELPTPATPVNMGSFSPFRLGMSARKRHHNATKYFINRAKDSNENRSGGWQWQNKSPTSSKVGLYATADRQDADAIREAQETARRERWRRGLEMEKRMFKNTTATITTGCDRDGDDHSYTDSLTQGSHTTVSSNTGYETGDFSSSVGDWTDATDDSGVARYNETSTGTGHCTSSQHVVESVAEDFGIFANLLLSDGYACFGTAAAITRETVAGCKSDNL